MSDLGELVADSAEALQAGMAELLPSVKSKLQGVIFSDKEGPASGEAEPGGPVRKLRRWLHLP